MVITSRCLYSWKDNVQVQTGLGPQAAERGQSFPQGEGLSWPRMGAPQERGHRTEDTAMAPRAALRPASQGRGGRKPHLPLREVYESLLPVPQKPGRDALLLGEG